VRRREGVEGVGGCSRVEKRMVERENGSRAREEGSKRVGVRGCTRVRGRRGFPVR